MIQTLVISLLVALVLADVAGRLMKPKTTDKPANVWLVALLSITLTMAIMFLFWYADEIQPVRNPIGGGRTYLWLLGIPIMIWETVRKGLILWARLTLRRN